MVIEIKLGSSPEVSEGEIERTITVGQTGLAHARERHIGQPKQPTDEDEEEDNESSSGEDDPILSPAVNKKSLEILSILQPKLGRHAHRGDSAHGADALPAISAYLACKALGEREITSKIARQWGLKKNVSPQIFDSMMLTAESILKELEDASGSEQSSHDESPRKTPKRRRSGRRVSGTVSYVLKPPPSTPSPSKAKSVKSKTKSPRQPVARPPPPSSSSSSQEDGDGEEDENADSDEGETPADITFRRLCMGQQLQFSVLKNSLREGWKHMQPKFDLKLLPAPIRSETRKSAIHSVFWCVWACKVKNERIPLSDRTFSQQHHLDLDLFRSQNKLVDAHIAAFMGRGNGGGNSSGTASNILQATPLKFPRKRSRSPEAQLSTSSPSKKVKGVTFVTLGSPSSDVEPPKPSPKYRSKKMYSPKILKPPSSPAFPGPYRSALVKQAGTINLSHSHEKRRKDVRMTSGDDMDVTEEPTMHEEPHFQKPRASSPGGTGGGSQTTLMATPSSSADQTATEEQNPLIAQRNAIRKEKGLVEKDVITCNLDWKETRRAHEKYLATLEPYISIIKEYEEEKAAFERAKEDRINRMEELAALLRKLSQEEMELVDQLPKLAD